MQAQIALKELARDLQRDGMLVVGTGVSIAASHDNPVASWTGLLHHAISYAGFEPAQVELLESMVAENDLSFILGAAHIVTERLQKRGLFSRCLAAVGRIPIHKQELIDDIHALAVPIATTNYDDLLTRGRTNMQPVPWTKPEAALQLLKGDRRGVLHLHGYFDDPESVIFDIRSYEKVLASDKAQAIQQAMAVRNTFLFIGCGKAGLSDPNVGRLIEWLTEAFGETRYKHYCLCASHEYAAMQERYPKLICIDYGTFDELSPFLRELAALLDRPKGATPLPPLENVYGREQEVGAVVDNLLAAQPKPQPILGGPGMGKTTIALKALRDEKVVQRYGARRWLVRCDGAQTVERMTTLIAQTMNLNTISKFEEDIVNELRKAPAVLVIDNAETPYESDRAELERFLARLADIRDLALVVTMRGLQTPDGVAFTDPVEMGSLTREQSRDLFLEHAGRRKFEADRDLEPLLDLMDGVPLALRLIGKYAAAHAKLKTVRAALEKAQSPQALDASFRLSVEPLEGDGKRALAILATFPGGVAHEDLGAVFRDLPNGIQCLRERALLVDEAGRIRLLAPLREYVVKTLQPQQDDLTVAFDHFFDLVISESQRIGSDEGADAIQRLTLEMANVEMLLARAAQGQWHRRIGDAAYRWSIFVQMTGLGSTEIFDTLVTRARAQNAPAPDLAECLVAQAQASLQRPEISRAAFLEAKSLYEHENDEEGQGICLIGLSTLDFNQSLLDGAQTTISQALPIFEKSRNSRRKADCLFALANIALEGNAKEDSSHYLRDAIPLYRRARYTLGEARCMKALADRAYRAEDDQQASKLYSDALALAQRAGSVMIEAHCVKGLAQVLLASKNIAQARERFEQALVLYQRVGDVRGIANSKRGFGDCARNERNRALAERWYREALAHFEQLEDNYAIGYTYRRLIEMTRSQRKRRPLIEAAINAWQKIKRTDLINELTNEFAAAQTA